MSRSWALLAFVLCPLALTDCGGRDASARLTLATGPAGSAFEQCGRALAAVATDPGLSVMVTGGAVESLEALGSGRAELALATADTLAQAVNGEGQFQGETVSARSVATLYASQLHLVVPEASPIHGFSQLRNHSVGIGVRATGTELTAMRALTVALLESRVSTRSMALPDAAAQIASGRLDAFFWLDAAPSPALERAARDHALRLRLLNNASVVSLLQRRYGPTLYEAAEVPVGAYGMTERTGTISVPTVLVSRHDLPEGAGYAIARSLFDRTARLTDGCPAARGLNVSQAARSAPAALHAGAARFYRESGLR